MARTAKRYKKNTEKKVSGIPVCMAAIYARLSVDSDLNAVKSFAGTSTQRNAFVWAIDVTGIENKTVFSISPLAPQTPVQVS